jgi:hypothetical protein
MIRVLALALVLLAAGTARAHDVVVLTWTPAISRALHSAMSDAEALGDAAGVSWSGGYVASLKHRKPYRVVIGLAATAAYDAEAIRSEIAGRFAPRYVVLLDVAKAVGDEPGAGDVAIGRLVWRYRVEKDDITPLRDQYFRADPALINASLALGSGWLDSIAPAGRSPTSAAGALASGTLDSDAQNDYANRILRRNPRTIAAGPEEIGLMLAAVSQHDNGTFGTVAIAGILDPEQTVHGADSTSDAAVHSAAFLLALLRTHWPLPPR